MVRLHVAELVCHEDAELRPREPFEGGVPDHDPFRRADPEELGVQRTGAATRVLDLDVDLPHSLRSRELSDLGGKRAVA